MITVLSLRPHIDTGNLPYNDKVAHFLVYFLFAFLAWRVTSWNKRFIALSVTIIIYSGLIEVAQQYTGHMMSFYDLVANTLGVITAVVALYFLEKRVSNTLF